MINNVLGIMIIIILAVKNKTVFTVALIKPQPK